MGKAISLRISNLWAKARKVAKQIETARLSDPIMRRPRAEKRVTRGMRRAKRELDQGRTA